MNNVTFQDYIQLPYKIISVTGEDSERFLQGQVSCDIEGLSKNQVTFGTANTPKGRMYALFKLLKTDDGFLIRVHQSIASVLIETLAKYKVFFKCDISLREDLRVYGTKDSDSDNEAETNTCTIEGEDLNFFAGKSRLEIWTTRELPRKDSNEALSAWMAEDCLQGIPELYPETVDQFILQFLNLDELNAVSFTKGCYTGQEIIARMKYLGKLKKRMFLLSSNHSYEAIPGSPIYDGNERKIGELVRLHINEKNGTIALAVLPIDIDNDSSEVYLDASATCPMSVQQLSYK